MMKKIFLIEKSPDIFNTITSCLEENQLFYSQFKNLDEALKSGEVPSLIVLFVNNNTKGINIEIEALKSNPSFSRIPRIFIFPFEMTGIIPNSEIISGQSSFQVPVDKMKFLSTVSKFLKRSTRRVFRIVISVQPEESNIRYSGISIDFSETGVAFESSSDLPVKQKIYLSFVNPKSRKRLLFKGEIARKASTQPGGTAFYGIKLEEMSNKDKKDFINFLTGEE